MKKSNLNTSFFSKGDVDSSRKYLLITERAAMSLGSRRRQGQERSIDDFEVLFVRHDLYGAHTVWHLLSTVYDIFQSTSRPPDSCKHLYIWRCLVPWGSTDPSLWADEPEALLPISRVIDFLSALQGWSGAPHILSRPWYTATHHQI